MSVTVYKCSPLSETTHDALTGETAKPIGPWIQFAAQVGACALNRFRSSRAEAYRYYRRITSRASTSQWVTCNKYSRVNEPLHRAALLIRRRVVERSSCITAVMDLAQVHIKQTFSIIDPLVSARRLILIRLRPMAITRRLVTIVIRDHVMPYFYTGYGLRE